MYTEKSPLTASQPAYTYHDPTRQYKKQVKRFQCLLCLTVLALLITAVITAMMLSVDDNDLDTIINANSSSLEGKLSASQGDAESHGPLRKSPGDSSQKPIKLYTSGIVVNGMATGGLEGEESLQVFDGTLPVTIPLDDIIDPTAYSPTAQVSWSGVVTNNNTVAGTYSVPIKVANGSTTYTTTYKGKFQVELAFKWSNNLDIVISNKVYQCKMIFQAAYGASLGNDAADIAKNTVKGKDDLTKETCALLLQGSFYEKSFICYFTPWWCSDQKLFYWNGGVEFKIIKPPMMPTSPPTAKPVQNNDAINGLKKLNAALNSGSDDAAPMIFGYKILGKVANGWVTTQDETGTKTIWNGELPANISLDMFSSNSADSGINAIGRNIKWSCSVFATSLRGSFSFPMTNHLGMSKNIQGSFFFLLESDPSVALNKALGSGTHYTSSLHFKDSPQVFNGTQIIDFPRHNITEASSNIEYITPVLLLGTVNKGTKSIWWDGTFEMVVKKVPQKENGSSEPVPSSDDDSAVEVVTKSLLGSQNAWSSNLTVAGSKLVSKVISGWVTLQGESGIKTIWGGEFPAQISVPMFFNPTTDMSDLSDEFGHGIKWSCTVYQSSLRGTFQLPQYTKFGLVKWLKGSFFFQLDSDPSWALSDTVYPNINYNSPLHFRTSAESYNGSQLIKFYSHDSLETLDSSGIKTPIILLGEFNKISGVFTWNGRFEMIIKKKTGTLLTSNEHAPNVPPPLNQQATINALSKSPSRASLTVPDPNAVGSKVIGKVTSGWITLTDSYGTHTIWNGGLPAKVSVPMFYNPTTDMSDLTDEYGHGAVWSCSIFHSTLKGTYQLPQYTKFGLVKWIKGSFFFELESTPYLPLSDNIVPGINYYSPIHFRNAGDETTNTTKMINLYSDNQSSPLDDLGSKAPIILLGKTSKGKGAKSFTWDGRFVLVIKKFF